MTILLLILPVICCQKNRRVYEVRIPSNIENKIKNFSLTYPKVYVETGISSYYHNKFDGRKTATGDVFKNENWTCAHKTLPIPSVVLVVFLYNKELKGIKLLVNDRGPFKAQRILDVSSKVAEVMNFHKEGITKVVLFFLPKETNNLLVSRVFQPDYKLLPMKEIMEILLYNKIFII